MVQLSGTICQISGILKLFMADNQQLLICSSCYIFRPYPSLKEIHAGVTKLHSGQGTDIRGDDNTPASLRPTGEKIANQIFPLVKCHIQINSPVLY